MLRSRGLLLCVVIISLLVTACTSMTRFAYNHLDWYMYRKVGRFVDLTDAQATATKAAIAEFHSWHRTTQLEAYAKWLQIFGEQVNSGPLTAKDVHDRIDELQNFLDACMTRLIPPSVEITQTLSDAQVKDILDNIREEREEYEEEYLDISEKQRREKHIENLRDAVDPWLGRLTKTQKQWIETWAEELEPFEQLNAKQQVIWEENVANILAERSDPEKLRAGLEGLMFYRTDEWQPELEAILDRNQQRTYELLAKLVNNMTSKQREHFMNKLEGFSEDFLTLSKTL